MNLIAALMISATVGVAPFAQESRTPLKSYFETGDIPSQEIVLDRVGWTNGFDRTASDTVAHKRPGPTRFSHICLKRGLTKSKSFFKWVYDSANRDVKRMGGKISLCNRARKETSRYSFFDTFPVQFVIPALDPTSKDPVLAQVDLLSEYLVETTDITDGLQISGDANDFSRLKSMEASLDGKPFTLLSTEPVAITLPAGKSAFSDLWDGSSPASVSSLVLTVPATAMETFFEWQNATMAGDLRERTLVIGIACTSGEQALLQFAGCSLYGFDQVGGTSDGDYRIRLTLNALPQLR